MTNLRSILGRGAVIVGLSAVIGGPVAVTANAGDPDPTTTTSTTATSTTSTTDPGPEQHGGAWYRDEFGYCFATGRAEAERNGWEPDPSCPGPQPDPGPQPGDDEPHRWLPEEQGDPGDEVEPEPQASSCVVTR